jgi:rare lipoprotein A
LDLDIKTYFTKVNSLVKIFSLVIVFIALITFSFFGKAKDNEYSDNYYANNNNLSNSYDYKYLGAIFEENGKASYYGKAFHNRRTASGERFDMFDLTAAHRKLPFGTIIRVTNESNNNVILVRINDRGPFIKGRILDLSHYAAQELKELGVPKVKIEGFDKNYLDKNSEDLKNSFLCYSFDYPLEIIEDRYLHFVDSTNEFKNAVELYNDYSMVDKETIWYICVSPQKVNDEPIYYITYPKDAYYFAKIVK